MGFYSDTPHVTIGYQSWFTPVWKVETTCLKLFDMCKVILYVFDDLEAFEDLAKISAGIRDCFL